MANHAQALSIASTAVRQFDNLYSLNDLHKAAGGDKKHQPSLFVRLEQTQALIAEINHSTDSQSAYKSINGGKNRGSYACKEIVYAYAMWISPKFTLEVIRTFDALHGNQIASHLINHTQQQQIKEAVNQLAYRANRTHQGIWRDFYNTFQIPRYQELPAERFNDAMHWLTGGTIIEPRPMSAEETIERIFAPNGSPLSPEFIARLGQACFARLYGTASFYKAKSQGLHPQVGFGHGINKDIL